MTLCDLAQNVQARIIGFNTLDDDLETRMREIGFAETDTVEIMHVGLFGRNPMTVRLNGAMIALRKAEASAIDVELIPQ